MGRDPHIFAVSNTTFTLSLEEIYHFDSIMKTFGMRDKSKKLLICTGSEPIQQIRILKLIGCHLILSHEMGFEAACLAFRPFSDLLQDQCSRSLSFETLLRSVCCAKCLNWINFTTDYIDSNDQGIMMDEYIHYAR